ncbi:MAG: ATP-binding protein [Bacteroidales bacterium]|nr:ATP-binding protein [Bacteroidales bacterium]
MDALFLAYNRRLEETQTSYLRYLYNSIDWNERLIGIKGAKGVGKTTMLLQHIKLTFPDRSQAFYVSLDNIWFSSHTLSELVEYLYTHGVTHLFLDEVHKYPTWIRELKNIYDDYPQLHIVFTGSSLLEIDHAEGDLSRRLRIYLLRGLSFREYLDITGTAQLSVLSIDEILNNHMQLASSITSKIKVLPHFEKYIRTGYYPFFLETGSEGSYFERLQQVVSTVIENDIPAIEKIEYETLQKAKRLLMTLAQSAPFTPNIANLCALLSTTRNQLIHLLSLLERAALILQLHTDNKGLKALGKPDKILFENTNLMYALGSIADAGTVRESFFSAMMSYNHTIQYAKQGDLQVDGRHIFEVGGKGKGFAQIANLPDSYVVADGIEIGFGNKIPLWLFGFTY